MHNDFFLCLSKLFAFAYFFYSSSILSNTYFILSHWWLSWEVLQIHRKKNFLSEQKIKEYQSKATFAKNKNSDEFFFRKDDNMKKHQIRMFSIRIIKFENRKKTSSDREFQTSKRRQKAKQKNWNDRKRNWKKRLSRKKKRWN